MARKFEEQKAKPSNDAYTGMLVVSFVALLIGCGLLYLDYSQYDTKPPPKLIREGKDVGQRPTPESEPKKQAKDTAEDKDTGADESKDTKDKDTPGDKKDTAKDTEK
jgi:hypothetical protein